MLYIRADANNVIATGHIMRCCAIADAMKERGDEVTFITADEAGETLVREKGYPCIRLGSKWDDLDSEIDKMTELIIRFSIEKLFVDTYYVTEKYLQALKEKTQVIYIDDLQEMTYPCHMLINYAVYAEDFPYRQEYHKTKLLLGCQYAPLRNVFAGLPKKQIKPEAENILVLTGGTDGYHFVRLFLELIMRKEQFTSLKFDVVCGRYNQDYEELKILTAPIENIRLHKNLGNLDTYMQQADIAVSAGGTTLYELCACGTPTICYAMADNQIMNVKAFQKLGVMYYCGDIRSGEACFDRIEKQICCWRKDPEERMRISRSMQQLVDGKGAYRIAEILGADT